MEACSRYRMRDDVAETTRQKNVRVSFSIFHDPYSSSIRTYVAAAIVRKKEA